MSRPEVDPSTPTPTPTPSTEAPPREKKEKKRKKKKTVALAPQRTTNADGLLQQLRNFNPETAIQPKKDEVLAYLVRYRTELFQGISIVGSRNRNIFWIVLDFFLAYGEDKIFQDAENQNILIEPLLNWLKDNLEIANVIESIFFYQNIILFLSGKADPFHEVNKLKLFKKLAKFSLEIINSSALLLAMRHRGLHFLLSLKTNFREYAKRRGDESIVKFDAELSEQLFLLEVNILPSEFMSALRNLDIKKVADVHHFLHLITCFLHQVQTIFEKMQLEMLPEYRTPFLLLIFLNLVGSGDLEKITEVSISLPNDNNTGAIESSRCVMIEGAFAEVISFKEKTIADLNIELSKPQPDFDLLIKIASSNRIQMFLDNDFLGLIFKPKHNAFLLPEIHRNGGEIVTALHNVTRKVLEVLGTGDQSNQTKACKFLLRPAVFKKLTVDDQLKVTQYYKFYLLEALDRFNKFRQEKATEEQKNKALRNLDDAIKFGKEFIKVYPLEHLDKLGARLHQRLQKLHGIYEALKEAEGSYYRFYNLYQTHIQRLINYIQKVIAHLPRSRGDIKNGLGKALVRLQNMNEFIKLHYNDFKDLNEGRISPRQFILKIVKANNSISIFKHLQNAEPELPKSTGFSFALFRRVVEVVESPTKFYQTYEPWSAQELKQRTIKMNGEEFVSVEEKSRGDLLQNGEADSEMPTLEF